LLSEVLTKLFFVLVRIVVGLFVFVQLLKSREERMGLVLEKRLVRLSICLAVGLAFLGRLLSHAYTLDGAVVAFRSNRNEVEVAALFVFHPN
jgi:phosphoglycerol transferase MdoB-like AlkP superfamily enzyme